MAGLARLGRDSLVYGLLDVANRFVGIFLVPLYTRVLAPADYGSLDLVTTLATVAYAVLYLGLDSALVQRFNATDDPERRREVVSSAFAVWLAAVTAGTALLLLAHAPLARATLPGVEGGERFLVLALVALPLQAATQVPTLLLRMRFRFRAYAVLSLGTLLLTVGLNLLFVLGMRMGVEGILLAQIVARVPAAVYGFAVTRREFAPRLSPELARGLVRYGAPLVLGNLTYWAMLYLERYALLRLGSLTDVGLFGVAARVATFVTLVSMAIDIAWTPFAMSIQRDPDAPAVYARALSWYLLLAGAAGTVLAVFAREALAVLTTPAYYGAAVIVGPVVAALVLRGASNIVSIGAMVTGRTRAVSGAALVSSAFQAACLLALVPLLGAVGAALATMGARLLAVVVLHLRTRRDYPVPYAWGRIARMAVVFTAAVVAAQAASRLGMWPGVAVKAGVILPAAAVALLATGALPPGEARALLALARARLSRFRGAAAPAP